APRSARPRPLPLALGSLALPAGTAGTASAATPAATARLAGRSEAPEATGDAPRPAGVHRPGDGGAARRAAACPAATAALRPGRLRAVALANGSRDALEVRVGRARLPLVVVHRIVSRLGSNGQGPVADRVGRVFVAPLVVVGLVGVLERRTRRLAHRPGR